MEITEIPARDLRRYFRDPRIIGRHLSYDFVVLQNERNKTMELKYKDIACCEMTGNLTTTHEETMETAIPEYCPDMARIVDTVGQLKIREKNMTEGRLTVAGAVKVTVLYTSEESAGLRSLSMSVPFSAVMEDKRLQHGSTVCVDGRLLLCEARIVTNRKLYLRVLPELTAVCYACPTRSVCCQAQEEPSLRIRQEEAVLELMTAAEEREFTFTQESMMGEGQEMPEDLLCDRISLAVTECQHFGNKLVVKGEAALSILYRSEHQNLCTYEAVLPFSQILDGIEAGEEAAFHVEARAMEGETRLLRTDSGCGFGVVQKIALWIFAYEKKPVSYVADLYSTRYPCHVQQKTVQFAADCVCTPERQEAVQRLEFGQSRPFAYLTDAACDQVDMAAGENGTQLHTRVRMRVLYLDETGAPMSTERSGEVSGVTREAPDSVQAVCLPAAMQVSGGVCEMRLPVEFRMRKSVRSQIVQVGSAELQTDAGAEEMPSLVLRRMTPEETLWDIAKQYRTDEAMIRSANQLEENEPIPARMLLIPKVR